MNAEIQNMIGVLIHVAKSDEFLDHEEKKVLKNIIYRYSVDSEDLKKIKISSCELSQKQNDTEKSSTEFDLYVQVPVRSKAVESLVGKGRELNLYQKKGSRRAYRVSKKVAVLDGEVSQEMCGKSVEGTKCLKAKYQLKQRGSRKVSRCKNMVSGKFFFSIKKFYLIIHQMFT